MRSFQRPATLDPVPAEVVVLLRKIDRAAGSEARHLDQVPQLLNNLQEQARIESVTASSAIEGVIVDPGRSQRIIDGRAHRLRNRSEEELAGYTAALTYLYTEDVGELTAGLLLHLHRILFSPTKGAGGNFKSSDNLVLDYRPDGTRVVRFEPTSARDTPHYVNELVIRTNNALSTGEHHPLLVIAAFTLDLLCIHPFEDGNGRVARLATAWLLTRYGYGVGRYASIEQLLFETKDDYYDSLARSTDGWFDDGRHLLWPWATYLLHQIAAAYRRFEARISEATTGVNKQDRVRTYVLDHAPVSFSIAEVRRALPGISDGTIRVVLNDLRDAGHIQVSGTGRAALWRRVPRSMTRPPSRTRTQPPVRP